MAREIEYGAETITAAALCIYIYIFIHGESKRRAHRFSYINRTEPNGCSHNEHNNFQCYVLLHKNLLNAGYFCAHTVLPFIFWLFLPYLLQFSSSLEFFFFSLFFASSSSFFRLAYYFLRLLVSFVLLS